MIHFGHTVTWDKIEILKEMDGWYKIRTKEGDVGFIENKEGTVLDELPKLISGISYINGQKLGYPSASEIISALMLLQYKNKRTTISEIISAIFENYNLKKEKMLIDNDGIFTVSLAELR